MGPLRSYVGRQGFPVLQEAAPERSVRNVRRAPGRSRRAHAGRTLESIARVDRTRSVERSMGVGPRARSGGCPNTLKWVRTHARDGAGFLLSIRYRLHVAGTLGHGRPGAVVFVTVWFFTVQM